MIVSRGVDVAPYKHEIIFGVLWWRLFMLFAKWVVEGADPYQV